MGMTVTKSKFCQKCGLNEQLHIKGKQCPAWPTLQEPESVDWKEELAKNANDRQVGVEDHSGGGYGADGVIQHWDYAASQKFDYFQGQITKYVTRWKKKGGLKDLQKAAHFLDKYLEVHERFKDS